MHNFRLNTNVNLLKVKRRQSIPVNEGYVET